MWDKIIKRTEPLVDTGEGHFPLSYRTMRITSSDTCVVPPGMMPKLMNKSSNGKVAASVEVDSFICLQFPTAAAAVDPESLAFEGGNGLKDVNELIFQF